MSRGSPSQHSSAVTGWPGEAIRTARSLGPTGGLALLIVAGEWTGIARALLGAPIYAGALDVLLILLSVATAIRAARTRPTLSPLVPVGLVTAYMALAAIEILNPNVPGLVVGMEGYRKTAFTMLAFLVVFFAGRENPIAAKRFFRITAIGSIPALLWAARQFLVPLPIDQQIIASSGVSSITFHSGSVLRAFSPTAGPFHLGLLSASVMIISLVEARSSKRWWWLALAVLAAAVLGLTLTRANLIAGVAALVLVAAFSAPTRERAATLAAALAPIATAVLAALFAVGAVSFAIGGGSDASARPSASASVAPAASDSLGHVISGVMNPLADKNLELRFGYWKEFAQAVVKQPLIGYGTSSAADGFGAEYAGTSSKLFQPHSMYFKAALEMGIGGLALLLAMLLWMARTSVRLLAEHRAEALMIGGVMTAVCVSGITGPMLDAYPLNVLFWASAGWLAALYRAPQTRGASGRV